MWWYPSRNSSHDEQARSFRWMYWPYLQCACWSLDISIQSGESSAQCSHRASELQRKSMWTSRERERDRLTRSTEWFHKRSSNGQSNLQRCIRYTLGSIAWNSNKYTGLFGFGINILNYIRRRADDWNEREGERERNRMKEVRGGSLTWYVMETGECLKAEHCLNGHETKGSRSIWSWKLLVYKAMGDRIEWWSFSSYLYRDICWMVSTRRRERERERKERANSNDTSLNSEIRDAIKIEKDPKLRWNIKE